MKESQTIIIDWLVSTGNDFLGSIAELEGSFESLPEEVYEAFEGLSDKEKIQVIKESAERLLT